MFRDLREFVDLLQREGELLTVPEELSPNQEITAAIREVDKRKGKALRLPQISGYPFSLVGNLLGHRRRVELAFGKPKDLLALYAERRKQLIPPKLVNDGPVK